MNGKLHSAFNRHFANTVLRETMVKRLLQLLHAPRYELPDKFKWCLDLGFAFLEDTLAGEMTYVWVDDSKFIIDHTEVDEAFGGKGYGKQLVMKAVEFAREQKIKIIPLCPFAARVFAKDSDMQDVKALKPCFRVRKRPYR